MCIPSWLGLYCKKLEACSKSKIEMGNDCHYDTVISLLALSANDESIIKLILK